MSATLRIAIQKQPRCPGDEFIAEVRIDAQEAINAGQGTLIFDSRSLELVAVRYGGSIFRYWQTQPSVTGQGSVSFTGGLPYPGFQGNDGYVFSAVFRMRTEFAASLTLGDDAQVLLNDGLGTPALLSLRGAAVDAAQSARICEETAPMQIVPDDTTPPEPFEVVITRDGKIFDGRYFAAFETTDTGTGVEYYEVRELSPYFTTPFTRTGSPYQLEVQGGTVTVAVRAVDGAGNVREAQATAELIPSPTTGIGITLIIFAGAILWLALVLCRRRRGN